MTELKKNNLKNINFKFFTLLAVHSSLKSVFSFFQVSFDEQCSELIFFIVCLLLQAIAWLIFS